MILFKQQWPASISGCIWTLSHLFKQWLNIIYYVLIRPFILCHELLLVMLIRKIGSVLIEVVWNVKCWGRVSSSSLYLGSAWSRANSSTVFGFASPCFCGVSIRNKFQFAVSFWGCLDLLACLFATVPIITQQQIQ